MADHLFSSENLRQSTVPEEVCLVFCFISSVQQLDIRSTSAALRMSTTVTELVTVKVESGLVKFVPPVSSFTGKDTVENYSRKTDRNHELSIK
jgi:hypothetical protein